MYKNKSEWRTKTSLSPGQRGTKAVCEQYGEQLLCIRYRYHVSQRRRIKTVELVIDEVNLPDAEDRPVNLIRVRFKAQSGKTTIYIESSLEYANIFVRMFNHPLLSSFNPHDLIDMTFCDREKTKLPKGVEVITVE